MIIYKATNLVNGKVYIGQTIQELWARKAHHKHIALKDKRDTIFTRAIRKYGWENFDWKIIDSASDIDELNQKEIYWINYYNSFGKNGYNSTLGGEGTVGCTHDEETRSKISETKISRMDSYEHIGLNSAVVQEIKELLMTELYTQKEVADMFGVKRNVINNIKCLKRWSHVHVEGFDEWAKNTNGYSLNMKRKSILNEDKVKNIKLLLKENNLTMTQIAEMFQVNKTTIANIKYEKAWKEVVV